jgi:hypothetical protein
MPTLRAMPMTSPVDFISGPSRMSLPWNFTKGRTDSFTKIRFTSRSAVSPSSFRVRPAAIFAATFAMGTPVALEMKGVVREARGFTSIT